jgi:gluconate 2-dehydrogenase gamma chain
MTDNQLSRRALLRSSLGFLTVEQLQALQHAHRAAQSGSTRLEYFDPSTAAEIEAIASSIIPTNDTPGAKEAGVIFFIDRALATFDRDKRELYRTGLAQAQEKRTSLFRESRSIAALTSEQRITLLTSIEKTEFFEAVRTHTVIGFLASPEWGGNRGRVGWKLIGLDDSAAFQPPFGYYDDPEHAA